MQAMCALCLQPVVKPRWLIAGTEVFHESCVKARGTTESIANRQKSAILDLKAEIDRLRYEVAREQQAAAEEREISRRISNERTEFFHRSDEYRRQRDEARRARDEAEVGREAARRELATVHLAALTAPIATPAIPVTPEPAKDDRDDTEIRFSLLELDGS